MEMQDLKVLLELDEGALKKLTKAKLIALSLCLQKELIAQINKHKQEQDDQIKKKINEEANKPSSKKPEWDKDGNPKTDSKKKQGPERERKKRPGCGNVSKSGVKPDKTNYTLIERCPDCGTDLSDSIGRKKKGRIVEDVEPPQMKTTVTEEIEEAKWCPKCKNMVSSKTETALPGSDIGLNATIEMAYLWVMSALSFAKIQDFLASFQALTISTAGISKSMIRLSGILQPVYEEILNDVKLGVRIHADETGWRVKGKLWWLWIFANDRSAYYWPDRKRGGGVVESILGEVFFGILIVDGWHAYNKIVCARQTCMAHIFRKIRGFIDAYPQYRSILSFYLKLRKIIRDGESLQKARKKYGEVVFQRRLKALQKRLDELLVHQCIISYKTVDIGR